MQRSKSFTMIIHLKRQTMAFHRFYSSIQWKLWTTYSLSVGMREEHRYPSATSRGWILLPVAIATGTDVCTTLNHPFAEIRRPPLGKERERPPAAEEGRAPLLPFHSPLPFLDQNDLSSTNFSLLEEGKYLLNGEVVCWRSWFDLLCGDDGSWNSFS